MKSIKDAPMYRLWLAALVATIVLGTGVPVAAAESSQAVEKTGDVDWWTSAYLVDYGIIAAGAAGYGIGERLTPRREALIGPVYDPDNPADIFDDPRVGQPYLEEGTGETVSTNQLMATMAGVGMSLAGVEAALWAGGDGSAHRLHDTMVGYAEATALTATATSMTKPFVGRLRPDFGERARRYHCTESPEEFPRHCGDYEGRPLAEEPEEAQHLLLDGRRSFLSGHASHSFNTFAYASLVVGGRYVWGEEATAASRAAGIAAQTALLGTATFIAASRITDGRHHPGDVIAGGAVGLGIANLAYWRRFDTTGALRRGDGSEDVRLTVQPFGIGPGVAMTVVY